MVVGVFEYHLGQFTGLRLSTICPRPTKMTMKAAQRDSRYIAIHLLTKHGKFCAAVISHIAHFSWCESQGGSEIILQRLHGSSEFALGNAVIILSVIVQYLPINVTLSKFTGLTVAYKENCGYYALWIKLRRWSRVLFQVVHLGNVAYDKLGMTDSKMQNYYLTYSDEQNPVCQTQ